MRGYKIVQEGNKWRFQLIPNNNNRQEVGSSVFFDSYEECVASVAIFRKFILDHHVNSIESFGVSVVQSNKEAFLEYRVNGQAFFRSRKYSSSAPKTQCKKCVASIYKHIDPYTLKRVF